MKLHVKVSLILPKVSILHDVFTCIEMVLLFFVYTHFTDIDECRENRHLCDHVCTNQNGSYSCSCHEGYDMDWRNSCTGTYVESWKTLV